jgi:hypothetical protein
VDAPIRAAAELGRLQRGLGLVGLGALSAVAATLVADDAARASARPGPVAVWVADRDACEVVGLDADLLRAVAVDLSWPVEVEACSDGGAWVAHAPSGDPSGEHRLVRITADGRVVPEPVTGIVPGLETGLVPGLATGPIADLDALDDGGVLALEVRSGGARPEDAGAVSGTTRVLRIDRGGARAALDLGSDARVAACAGGRVALGTVHGLVRVHDLSAAAPEPLAEGRFDGRVLDLAAGPAAQTGWAVIGGGDGAAGGRGARRLLV